VSSHDPHGVRDDGAGASAARPAALLAVRISPADVGRRVTVRRRLDESMATDVVGHLRTWDGGWAGALVVERRDGTRVEMRAADLLAARVVPPEISAEALQAVAESGWPPEETAPLGDWTLRAAGGVTGRANSVRVAGRPGVALVDALATVERWYADRAVPPLLQVPVPSAYDDGLASLGWVVIRRNVLLAAETGDALARTGRRPDADLVLVRSPRPAPEWLALVEPEVDPAALARILARPGAVVFVEARDAATGALLGAGRASAAPSAVGRWAGVTSIMTVPEARRRGVATAVVRELVAWSAETGCPHTYLQVLEENDTAQRLYADLGFALHHRYVYLSPQRAAPR
jgi:ribosomal protein S18 acetylase RimI-like enzyme